jgi:hypothetical protein
VIAVVGELLRTTLLEAGVGLGELRVDAATPLAIVGAGAADVRVGPSRADVISVMQVAADEAAQPRAGG